MLTNSFRIEFINLLAMMCKGLVAQLVVQKTEQTVTAKTAMLLQF